ncbi:hypothetical protein ACFC18_00800 [Streptomyces sp. NPDC056121]|uniref:hypothetical protein n=1 Tax=Streptomyces TaxID=1883 RepID=UPI001D0B48F8|nr:MULTISPECIES: hypothetical protein [Streptomyces]MCX5087076.1 hypothetical protein [Streptomyces sp. NBC_00401]UDM01935.1 hypothetical protein LGI35_28545 [Streptomyces longhuiensis]
MLLEALGSALLGLGLAWTATVRLPGRLPARALVLPTGIAGALFGAFLTHTALGSGHTLATLAGAVVVGVAFLSLLLRPSARVRRSAPA